MRRLKFLTFFILLSVFCKSQDAPEIKTMLNDGIALHDKGDYEAAIAKYDAVLKINPDHHLAMYEKSYSLMSLDKNQEAGELLKKILKDSKDPSIRKNCFVNYGTVLDLEGEGKKSVKLYEEGIIEFPGYYLLHFNKGITETNLKMFEEAAQSFKESVTLNPFHASSHNALGQLMIADKKRIPGILSLFSFLLIETDGNRAKQNLKTLNSLIMQGVQKKDDKSTVITIDASLLDKKNKKQDDDFSSAELMLSLVASNSSIPDSIGARSIADKLSYQLQMLINLIDETGKKDKGFFKSFYVPFFTALKKDKWMPVAANIAMATSGDADVDKWLDENKVKIDQFYEWMKNYKWVTGN